MLWRQGDLDAHRVMLRQGDLDAQRVLLRQLLAALIDDEEVMECSEGWRRDVKTVLKCSPSVVREHIAELLIDLEMGCSTLWRPRFASIMCWGGAGTSKYWDIAGQDDFSSDTDEGGWERT